MILLAVTADTWIVTGLGFGIVLLLLFCLVFILLLFGWVMQKATAPKPKPVTAAAPTTKAPGQPVQPAKPVQPKPTSEPAVAGNDDIAAIAMALYLASRDVKHDVPTSMIPSQARGTAWNNKSIGLNNIGF